MSALVRFLQGVIDAIVAGLSWAVRMLGSFFEGIWRAFLGVLDQILAWALALLDWVVLGAVSLFFGFLEALAGLLPAMPEKPAELGVLGDALALANRYVPITEVLQLAVLWGVIYAGMYAYKGYRAIRGGG